MDDSLRKTKPNFTGICICGHHFDDHHHGVIARPQILEEENRSFQNVGGLLGQECERTEVNGMRIREDEPPCSCSLYWDRGWPPRKIS